MANLIGDMRTCPTRIDRADVLFAHRVAQAHCADRQRCGYHKCYTCSYNHTQVMANGLPDESRKDLRFEEASKIPHAVALPLIKDAPATNGTVQNRDAEVKPAAPAVRISVS